MDIPVRLLPQDIDAIADRLFDRISPLVATRDRGALLRLPDILKKYKKEGATRYKIMRDIETGRLAARKDGEGETCAWVMWQEDIEKYLGLR